jgi:hypothetical protein
MLNQFLQCSERGATSNEKSTFIQLPDTIVLHCISIPNCNKHTYETDTYGLCNAVKWVVIQVLWSKGVTAA